MKFHYFYIAIVFLLEIDTILPSFGAPSNSQLQKKPTAVAKTATTNTSQITQSKKGTSSTSVKNAASNAHTTSAPLAKEPPKNQAGSSGKTIVLQGQVKRHKHPLRSLLKEEFDSPIHPITTDNKDF